MREVVGSCQTKSMLDLQTQNYLLFEKVFIAPGAPPPGVPSSSSTTHCVVEKSLGCRHLVRGGAQGHGIITPISLFMYFDFYPGLSTDFPSVHGDIFCQGRR